MTYRKKIEYEWQLFYLDLLRTSKENIFAHSDEIEMKKALREALYQLQKKIKPEIEKLLLVQNNLLESAYAFYITAKQNCEDAKPEDVVECWLDFLVNKKRDNQK